MSRTRIRARRAEGGGCGPEDLRVHESGARYLSPCSEVIQVIGRSNFDHNFWMSVQQFRQYWQKTGVDEPCRCADPHSPASASVRRFRKQGAEPLDAPQHITGLVEPPFTLVHKGYGTRGTVEEPDTCSASKRLITMETPEVVIPMRRPTSAKQPASTTWTKHVRGGMEAKPGGVDAHSTLPWSVNDYNPPMQKPIFGEPSLNSPSTLGAAVITPPRSRSMCALTLISNKSPSCIPVRS